MGKRDQAVILDCIHVRYEAQELNRNPRLVAQPTLHVVQKGFWRFKLQMESCFAKATLITETLSLWLLYGKQHKSPIYSWP